MVSQVLRTCPFKTIMAFHWDLGSCYPQCTALVRVKGLSNSQGYQGPPADVHSHVGFLSLYTVYSILAVPVLGEE